MLGKLFPDSQVRLDPWSSDYGSSLLASEESEEALLTRVKVDCSVEMSEKNWRPVDCNEGIVLEEPSRVAFVDGVRRIECNLVFEGGVGFRYGAFGSFAAGGVVVTQGRLNKMSESLAVCAVKRYVMAPEDVEASENPELSVNFPMGSSVKVCVYRIAGQVPTESVIAIQHLMREEEAVVCRELAAKQAADLLIADGPLNLALLKHSVVGFIKSFHNLYVSYSLCPVLTQLRPGERTPIFLIEPRNKKDSMRRYSCYARISARCPQDSSLAGLGRFEVSTEMGFGEAQRLLSLCAKVVPRFGSQYGRDPRAPQNLFPLGALEHELRRRLGSPEILRRVFQAALAA
jgi:hypothetical protein